MSDELDIVRNRIYVLFNPRHDKIGRFAAKSGGVLHTGKYIGPEDHSKDMPKYEAVWNTAPGYDDFVSAKIENYNSIAEKSIPALKKHVENYGKSLVHDAIEGQIQGDISSIDDKQKREAATKALRSIKSKL